jgi:opacity protein-like surface antigen
MPKTGTIVWTWKWSWIGAIAAALLCTASPALAQISYQPQEDAEEEHRPWSASGGIGFTLDPGTFLMTLGIEYADEGGFSAGPLVQFGVSDNNTIIAPTVNGRYSFDLSHLEDEILQKFRPFVQGGLGFAYIDKDRNAPKKDKDDVGFLMNMGLGLEYQVSDSVTLGNNLLFNVLPDKTARQNFFFSWQFATVRFHF